MGVRKRPKVRVLVHMGVHRGREAVERYLAPDFKRFRPDVYVKEEAYASAAEADKAEVDKASSRKVLRYVANMDYLGAARTPIQQAELEEMRMLGKARRFPKIRHIERFSEAESKRIGGLYEKAEQTAQRGVENFVTGRLEPAIAEFLEAIGHWTEAGQARDAHAVENLKHIIESKRAKGGRRVHKIFVNYGATHVPLARELKKAYQNTDVHVVSSHEKKPFLFKSWERLAAEVRRGHKLSPQNPEQRLLAGRAIVEDLISYTLSCGGADGVEARNLSILSGRRLSMEQIERISREMAARGPVYPDTPEAILHSNAAIFERNGVKLPAIGVDRMAAAEDSIKRLYRTGLRSGKGRFLRYQGNPRGRSRE